MHTFLNNLKYFLAGALFGSGATTTFEYIRKYNLFDWVKDHILALFGHKA